MPPKLTKQDAKIVVLELAIRGLRRLTFDSPDIAAEDNKLLADARDKQIERLQENLNHARKVAS